MQFFWRLPLLVQRGAVSFQVLPSQKTSGDPTSRETSPHENVIKDYGKKYYFFKARKGNFYQYQPAPIQPYARTWTKKISWPSQKTSGDPTSSEPSPHERFNLQHRTSRTVWCNQMGTVEKFISRGYNIWTNDIILILKNSNSSVFVSSKSYFCS